MTALDLIKRNNGSRWPGGAPVVAWPGGYPIAYYCNDGELLCGHCVRANADKILAAPGCLDDQWWVVDAEALEGTHEDYGSTDCAHCGEDVLAS